MYVNDNNNMVMRMLILNDNEYDLKGHQGSLF